MTSVRFVVRSAVVGTLALVASLVTPPPAFGQYQGNNFHGDFGVNSGTQPPPGIFVGIPFAQWNADNIKDADGDPFLPAVFQGFDLRAIPATVIGVTSKKIAGANYGFMVAFPFSTVWPERVTEQGGGPDWAYTDMYIVPLYLGWHKPRADFVAGYGLFVPTGRYEAGASDNTGLGMWSHEIQGGATVYLDSARKVSASTTAYFEMHSNKKDQDLKVGNLLTLEGGAAYNVPRIGGAFGIGYYLQNKTSDDTGTDVPEAALRALNLYGHNRLFGIGPDVTMGLFQRGTTIGALNVRYFWDSAAKTSFEGGTLWISFSVGKIRQ